MIVECHISINAVSLLQFDNFLANIAANHHLCTITNLVDGRKMGVFSILTINTFVAVIVECDLLIDAISDFSI